MLAGLQASSLLCHINIPSPAHSPCLEMMGDQPAPHAHSCPCSASRRRGCTQKMSSAQRKQHSPAEQMWCLSPVPWGWHQAPLCALSTAHTISALCWGMDQTCRHSQGPSTSKVFISPLGLCTESPPVAFLAKCFKRGSWCLPTALFLV